MKKLLIGVFVLSLLLAGCSQAPGTSGTAGPVPTTTKPYGTFVPPTGGHNHPHNTQPTTKPSLGPADFILYLPTENADGFTQKSAHINELDAEGVLLLLMVNRVVNENVVVKSCDLDGKALKLDMNQAFLDQLMAIDDNGEKMLIGSLVNTFLSAYDCETVLLTVEGQAFNTEHTTYDSPLTFVE